MNFCQQVYQVVQKIPYGKVATYGQVALLCGNPRAARAVGSALHHNPAQGIIPCHRVVNREGRPAPAFVFGGPQVQRTLLESEGVQFTKDGLVDMKRFAWHGDASDSL